MLVRVTLLSPNRKTVKEILDALSEYPSIYKVRGLYYGFRVNGYTLHLSHSNDCTHFSINIEDKNYKSIFKIEKTEREWNVHSFARKWTAYTSASGGEMHQVMGLFELMDLAESVWKLISKQ